MFVMEYKIILLFMLLLVSFAVYGENGLSDEDKNVLLQAHNYYRSLAAESAANMERMVWNRELESLAKQHADKCHVAFNDNMSSSGLVFDSVGENQAISSSPTINYHLLVGKWYEEGKNYEHSTKSCAAEESCHRYLQLIWAQTTDVGCAVKRCKHAVPSVTLLVCHYGPGMIEGELPYEEGPPCSACPSEHHICRNNLCTTAVQKGNGETQKMVPVPHFIMVLSTNNTAFCYEVQATNGLVYNIISNKRFDMTGFFTHYKDELNRLVVLLDTVSLRMNIKDSKSPKDIVLSRSKQQIRVDDFVLSVRQAHSVTVTETRLVIIPTKRGHHTEVFVILEKFGLQFTALFQNSQLQLFVSQISYHGDDDPNSGLVGQFFQERTRIDEDTNLLTLQGFDPINVVQSKVSYSNANYQSCFFIVNPTSVDLESHHITSGLQPDDNS